MDKNSHNTQTAKLTFIWVLIIAFAMPNVGAARVLTDEQLFNQGLTAYERLPEFVTAANAETFVKAVKYLYAYEQRWPRAMQENSEHERQISAALDWLRSNIPNLTAYAGGKGEPRRIRSDASLLAEGCDALKRLLMGDFARHISSHHGEEFLGAIANLYAYYQRTGKANARPCNAKRNMTLTSVLDWLDRNAYRLSKVQSAAKGDPGMGWLPHGARPKVERLGQIERVPNKALGMSVQNLTAELAAHLGYEDKGGVVILEVEPGSPAARAGLRSGMLISQINRRSVEDTKEFQKMLAKSGQNKWAVLLLVRDRQGSRFVALRLD